MAERGAGKFLIYSILVLALFLSLLEIVFGFSGVLIRVELLFFVIFLIVSFIGLTTYTTGGKRLLFVSFVFHLLNLIGIWFVTQKLFLLPVLLSLFGFLLSFPKKRHAYEEPELSSELAVARESVTPSKETYSKVMHSPGKFAASKYGTVYHAPKCDWAKKIKEKSLVWFSSENEAKKAGYKAHSCV